MSWHEENNTHQQKYRFTDSNALSVWWWTWLILLNLFIIIIHIVQWLIVIIVKSKHIAFIPLHIYKRFRNIRLLNSLFVGVQISLRILHVVQINYTTVRLWVTDLYANSTTRCLFLSYSLLYVLHSKNARLCLHEIRKMEVLTQGQFFKDFQVYGLLFVLFRTLQIKTFLLR